MGLGQMPPGTNPGWMRTGRCPSQTFVHCDCSGTRAGILDAGRLTRLGTGRSNLASRWRNNSSGKSTWERLRRR
jgi:hypothetical protein